MLLRSFAAPAFRVSAELSSRAPLATLLGLLRHSRSGRPLPGDGQPQPAHPSVLRPGAALCDGPLAATFPSHPQSHHLSAAPANPLQAPAGRTRRPARSPTGSTSGAEARRPSSTWRHRCCAVRLCGFLSPGPFPCMRGRSPVAHALTPPAPRAACMARPPGPRQLRHRQSHPRLQRRRHVRRVRVHGGPRHPRRELPELRGQGHVGAPESAWGAAREQRGSAERRAPPLRPRRLGGEQARDAAEPVPHSLRRPPLARQRHAM